MGRILENLNPQQKQAVEHGEGPMLVLAGAGSGKTRILTYRIIYLIIKRGVSPFNILAVTFTNKAALEMRERIARLLKSNYNSVASYPFTGTFHSFCAWILRREGKYINIPQNFVIYDEYDQTKLVKNILKKLKISPQKFKPSSILTTISQAKNELISPNHYQKIVANFWQEVAAIVYPQYQKALEECGALDFDDLLVKTVGLFKKEKDILQKYQKRFQYILIDEYQDTNTAQYKLTKLLAGEKQNICVVGDCSQSIYSWRGADYRNVLNFKKAFPKTSVYRLEQNYRSTQNILDAAHSVIESNSTHPILSLWTQKDRGEKVFLYEAFDEKDEADFIIRTILKDESKNSGCKPGDFAVLYRTNAQSRAIEEAFLHYGLPYVLVGGVRFYDRAEIKDILCYLRLIINCNDEVALERANKTGKKRARSLLEYIQREKELTEQYTTLQLMGKVLFKTGYLEKYDRKKEEDRVRLENIAELQSVAAEYPKLIDFLENVALVEKEASSVGKNNKLIRKGKDDAATLLTLHQAKGLEYNTVFIVGMEEGLFPHSRSMDNSYMLEEERRLAYVGMTRAQERLYLTYATQRLYFGRYARNEVSRFIRQIPKNLLTSL